jgi:hypothetical protein
MVAYEFNWRDEINGDKLICILPKRRKKPERITEESIMNWVRQFLNNDLDVSNIFFVKVTVDINAGEIF